MSDKNFIEESTPVFSGETDSVQEPTDASVRKVASENATRIENRLNEKVRASRQATAPQVTETKPDIQPPQSSGASWDEEKTIIVGAVPGVQSKVVLVNASTGQKTEVNNFPFVIGRHRSCDLQLSHNSVSRRHAIISRQDDDTGYFLEDAGSANGTLLNGVRTDKVVLNSGDKLQLGEVIFAFSVLDQEPLNDALASPIKLPKFQVPSFGSKGGVAQGMSAKLSALKQRFKPSAKASGKAADVAGEETTIIHVEEFDGAAETVVMPEVFDSKKDSVDSKTDNFLDRFRGSRYPLLAAVAAVVLAGAYFLSPARRVTVIDATPVASAPTQNQAADVSSEQPDAPAGTSTSQERNGEAGSVAKTDDSTTQSDVTPTADAANEVTGSENQVARIDEREIATTDLTATPDNSSEQTEVAPDSALGKSTANIEDNNSSTDLAISSNALGAETTGAAVANATEASVDSEAQTPAPVVAKKVIRRSPAWSRGYINNSLDMYVAGDVENAVRRLGILSRSARHQQRFRDESAGLVQSLNSLYDQYASGRSLMDQGQEDAAFTTWRNYLLQEQSIFPQRESVFARGIKDEVVRVYTRRGNDAYASGNPGAAYEAWQQASSISPNGEAAASLQDLQRRAKERFIEGYRQESVNMRTAIAMWQDVVALVPPQNEYHVKAKAKLRLYKNYGTQQ